MGKKRKECRVDQEGLGPELHSNSMFTFTAEKGPTQPTYRVLGKMLDNARDKMKVVTTVVMILDSACSNHQEGWRRPAYDSS